MHFRARCCLLLRTHFANCSLKYSAVMSATTSYTTLYSITQDSLFIYCMKLLILYSHTGPSSRCFQTFGCLSHPVSLFCSSNMTCSFHLASDTFLSITWTSFVFMYTYLSGLEIEVYCMLIVFICTDSLCLRLCQK